MGGAPAKSLPRTLRQIVLLSAAFLMASFVGVSVPSADTTPTPTATKTCTPGAHPAPGRAYEGPTFTQTPNVSPTPTRTPNSSGLCGDVCDGQACGVFQCSVGGPLEARRCTVPSTHGCECEPIECPTLSCAGDCNDDGAVTVDEILRLVNIALNGDTSPSACRDAAQWCSAGPVADIGITCIVDAVNNALNGCGAFALDDLFRALVCQIHSAPTIRTHSAPGSRQ